MLANTCHMADARSNALSWENGPILPVQNIENMFDERILYLGCAVSTQGAVAAWRDCVSLVLAGWRWCKKDPQCGWLALQPCPGALAWMESNWGRNKALLMASNMTWKVLFLRRRWFPILPARHVTPLCWGRERMAAPADSGEDKMPKKVPRAWSIAACPRQGAGATPSTRTLTAF